MVGFFGGAAMRVGFSLISPGLGFSRKRVGKTRVGFFLRGAIRVGFYTKLHTLIRETPWPGRPAHLRGGALAVGS